MNLVELWTYGEKDSENFILVTPIFKKDKKFDNGWVVNGAYYINRDKKKNVIKINVPSWIPNKEHTGFSSKLELTTHKAYYLGDVELLKEKQGFAGYNWTIWAYEKTKKVKGRNLIKAEIVKEFKKSLDESDVPF
jgi:hypothetical protein